jgi:hypothetical protein
MESNYNNRDFEQFVKQNADQYRMFPSEKVWQGIDNALHTRRKWYGLGLALLLLITGAGVTWVMIATPGNKNVKTTTAEILPQNPKAVTEAKATTPKQPATPVKNTNAPLVFSNDAVQAPKTNTSFDDILLNNEPVDQADQRNRDQAALLQTTGAGIEEAGATMASIPAQKATRTIAVASGMTQDIVPFTIPPQTVAQADILINTVTDKKPEANTEKTQPARDSYSYYPLTIESVINSYKRAQPKKKVTFQFYFTPTVSYRKLSENKEFLRYAASMGAVPTYAAYTDVKNYVTHKPDIGLELGIAARYPISRRLTVKAGLQFNVSRYDIRAFTSTIDTGLIRLNATGSDTTFERETTYQTRSNGNRANWLQNLYYSVSVPIGVEYRFAEKNKNHFGIAATVQPTYIISDKAYLITTNYKNYVTVPGSIIRRFNLNTGFHVFVGYSTDHFNWQIGPQVRYQTRSTFKDKYPVKENLFDFGIKVGVTFNKNKKSF